MNRYFEKVQNVKVKKKLKVPRTLKVRGTSVSAFGEFITKSGLMNRKFHRYLINASRP